MDDIENEGVIKEELDDEEDVGREEEKVIVVGIQHPEW